MMKSLYGLLLLCAASALSQQTDRICCEMNAKPESPPTVDAVPVKVTITNASSSAVSLLASTPERDLRFEITDSAGQRPALTSYGKAALEGEHRGSSILKTIGEGQSFTQIADLAKLFQLRSGQKYSVRILRSVHVGEIRTELKSEISLKMP